ncbi:hypothetical protein IV203_030615 [Nitzschia inconspicua]|uniref:Nucleoside transporter n=1 Tax=Nitzschia inconspicua TaxID=303405 RepID=A0A9K3Q1E3_9STRA|nr:hypothetical protein IV203_015953 [Nitzschia inconspicua]KAG7367872.1 hypothetical protein IV203_030615 [Nitzschia inconspicua]
MSNRSLSLLVEENSPLQQQPDEYEYGIDATEATSSEFLLPDDNNSNNNDDDDTTMILDLTLFFLSGLGSSMGYISSLSSLVHFQQVFGNNFFVLLNVAIYLPLVPISIAQATWDQQYDRYFATLRAFVFRTIIGYGLVITGTIGLIFTMISGGGGGGGTKSHKPTHYSMVAVVISACLQGVGGAILYGQLNQLASFVTKNGYHATTNLQGTFQETFLEQDSDTTLPRKCKAAVSAGVQASALAVLVLSWTSGFETMNEERFPSFLWMVVVAVFICFLAMLWLLIGRPRVRASMIQRDSSMQLSITSRQVSFQRQISSPPTTTFDNITMNNDITDSEDPIRQPLLLLSTVQQEEFVSEQCRASNELQPSSNEATMATTSTSLFPSQTTVPIGLSVSLSQSTDLSECYHPATEELSFEELLRYSRPSCLVMAMTLIPSFLVGSWFTRVRTNRMELPQILFYVRIGMDFLGRLATILPWVVDTAEPSPYRDGTDDDVPTNGNDDDDNNINNDMSWVVRTTLARWLVVILFFVNSRFDFVKTEGYRDLITITLVAFIAFLSGFLVTTCYQMAPQQLPIMMRTTNAAKQASILTVAFALSALGGLLLSFLLIALGV